MIHDLHTMTTKYQRKKNLLSIGCLYSNEEKKKKMLLMIVMKLLVQKKEKKKLQKENFFRYDNRKP